MKKLMVIAAVAIMAGIANAASMQWGTGVMYKPNTDNDGAFSSTKAKATVTAYLFELTATEYATLVVLDANSAPDYAASAEKIFKQYATVTENLFSIADGLADGSGKTGTTTSYKNFNDSREFEKGDTAYAAMIFKYSDAANETDYYIANVASYAFDEDVDGSLLTLGTNQFGTGAALTGWTAVPEPTSGLLLLIGMAGLALRRKRM